MKIKDSGLVFGSFGENREETIIEFNIDHGFDEFSEGFCVELVARYLSLQLPSFSVGVEYSVAEEIKERFMKYGTFTVAREVGFENVLDHRGVSREDLAGA